MHLFNHLAIGGVTLGYHLSYFGHELRTQFEQDCICQFQIHNILEYVSCKERRAVCSECGWTQKVEISIAD